MRSDPVLGTSRLNRSGCSYQSILRMGKLKPIGGSIPASKQGSAATGALGLKPKRKG